MFNCIHLERFLALSSHWLIHFSGPVCVSPIGCLYLGVLDVCFLLVEYCYRFWHVFSLFFLLFFCCFIYISFLLLLSVRVLVCVCEGGVVRVYVVALCCRLS